MPFLTEPEASMSRNQLVAALKRLVNELPTIVAAAAAVAYVVGFDLDVTGAAERIEGVVAFVLWLLVRASTDGPVTLAEKRKHRQLLEAGDLPEFVHYDTDDQ